jgi:predicted Rossmann fold nucleotide-binding protein DprA/Smf involved in DNA uptake
MEVIAMFRVIIAGSRYFNNYELLKKQCDLILQNRQPNVIVISGKARGADSLGERYAKERGYQIIEFPADWNRYGRRAGPKRNELMAQNADGLIAFWDGKSKGTANMINLANRYGLKVAIVRTDREDV